MPKQHKLRATKQFAEAQPTLQRAAIAPAPDVAPPIVNDVLQSSGEALDEQTRAFMEPRFGHDFSGVRVHTDDQAAQSADEVSALAYTVGSHVAFDTGQYQPQSSDGKRLLAHELAHVVQQQGQPPTQLAVDNSNSAQERQAQDTAQIVMNAHSTATLANRAAPQLSHFSAGVMRAPAPDTAQPRTFIIVYGSGQVNPTTNEHNVGTMFRMVANQKLREIKARLGNKAGQHTFVFEYTPTEVELKQVLNQKYAAPVAEVHIFSHGWDEGANLGGPLPPDLKKRPTETPEEAEQRRMTKGDLGGYEINFADDATVVFYGCNIGNIGAADNNRPFAQDFSDTFGVSVTASTKSTHFENKVGWHQVPDAGGKMIDFTSTPGRIQLEVESYKRALQQLFQLQDQLKKPTKLGPIGLMMREDKIATLRAEVDKKRSLVHRLIRFLPEADHSSVLDELTKLEALTK